MIGFLGFSLTGLRRGDDGSGFMWIVGRVRVRVRVRVRGI